MSGSKKKGQKPWVPCSTTQHSLAFCHNARLTRKPAPPMCRRKHSTPGNHACVHAPGLPQELLERNGTRTSLPAEPSPNPKDAGPIVRRLMGLPVTAGCDRDWDQTWVCSDASSTVMQGLDRCTTQEALTFFGVEHMPPKRSVHSPIVIYR